jgi:uncharacterized damage-inducible protein DinB
MSLVPALLAELDQEAASTRRILARIPADQGDYKPHAKSMSLGQLAVHVAELYSWLEVTLANNELDFAARPYQPAPFVSGEELVARMDGYLAIGRPILEASTEATLAEPWTMRAGDKVFFTMPKGAVLRTFVYNHIVHHRAQLTVYLRLLDLPIPGLYGPSADEG